MAGFLEKRRSSYKMYIDKNSALPYRLRNQKYDWLRREGVKAIYQFEKTSPNFGTKVYDFLENKRKPLGSQDICLEFSTSSSPFFYSSHSSLNHEPKIDECSKKELGYISPIFPSRVFLIATPPSSSDTRSCTLPSKKANNNSPESNGNVTCIIEICSCDTCLRGVLNPKVPKTLSGNPIDLYELQPLVVKLRITYLEENTVVQKFPEIQFLPAYTSKFDIKLDVDKKNRKTILFCGSTSISNVSNIPWTTLFYGANNQQGSVCNGRLNGDGYHSHDGINVVLPHLNGSGERRGLLKSTNTLAANSIGEIFLQILSIDVYKKDEHMCFKSLICKQVMDENLFPDFTIVSSDGAKHSCHRCILGARSKVLRVMMEQESWVEGKERQLNLTESSDMTSGVVKSLLNFLYYGGTEAIEEFFDLRTVTALLKFSHRFEIQELMLACYDTLYDQQAYQDFATEPFADLWDLYLFVRLLADELLIMQRIKYIVLDALLWNLDIEFYKEGADFICRENSDRIQRRIYELLAPSTGHIDGCKNMDVCENEQIIQEALAYIFLVR